MVKTSSIKIKCADDFSLAGTLYEPSEACKAAVVIAPATGIKRAFYHAFANFLGENGYGVITFENRGIGDSKGNAGINDVNASLVNWGRLDMTAALEELKKAFPATTAYHLVGHSAGGQLVGLMENAHELRSMFNFGSSSGSLSNGTYPFKFQAIFWLNVVIPVSNLLLGYTKSEWFGMGESLPKLVASEWRRWCSGKGYVEVDLGKSIHKHSYDDLMMPSLWLHAADDNIANYKNVKDMIRVYSKIDAEIVTLDPVALGYEEIGHMKFFSSKKKKLWVYALDWLEKH